MSAHASLRVERVENPDTSSSIHLANSYLVWDEPGGSGVIIDSNGLVGELLDKARAEDVTISGVLITHHHFDHVMNLQAVLDEAGHPPLLMHPLTAEMVGAHPGRLVHHGESLKVGGIKIKAIETPGHCADHLSYLAGGTDLFCADALFAGSLGVTLSYGPGGVELLRRSVIDRLLALPPETRIHPGHGFGSTVGRELEENVFVRVWRGLDPEGTDRCIVSTPNGEEEATLIVWGPNYDGGHKAWVRFNDGEEAILPGSHVVSR